MSTQPGLRLSESVFRRKQRPCGFCRYVESSDLGRSLFDVSGKRRGWPDTDSRQSVHPQCVHQQGGKRNEATSNKGPRLGPRNRRRLWNTREGKCVWEGRHNYRHHPRPSVGLMFGNKHRGWEQKLHGCRSKAPQDGRHSVGGHNPSTSSGTRRKG